MENKKDSPDLPPGKATENVTTFDLPDFLPTNGRIICGGTKKQNKKVQMGNVELEIVPVTKDNFDRTRSNPFEGFEYYVLALTPDVNANLKKNKSLPVIPGTNTTLEIEILDKLVVSEKMEPVVIESSSGLHQYFVWHYLDIIGFIKHPENMKKYTEKLEKLRAVK